MRERTPSADDTPKRAPPAPSREAASADVLVDGRSARVVVADSSRTSRSSRSSSTEKRIRTMVASTRGPDDLGSSQSAISDCSQQQHHQHQPVAQHQQSQNRHYLHANNQYASSNPLNSERPAPPNNRTAQTAQDKRSRLSNVINNLRKKVPTESPIVDESHRSKDTSIAREERRNRDEEEEDDDDDARNSVERNLANLEKYVMTVLNGVIKDAETKDEANGDAERSKVSSILVNESQNLIGTSNIDILVRKSDGSEDAGSKEASRPNESRLEAAFPVQPDLELSKIVVIVDDDDKDTSKKDDSIKIERSTLSADISRDPRLENDAPEDRVELPEGRAAESTFVVGKTSNDPFPEAESQRRTSNDVDRLFSAVTEFRLTDDSSNLENQSKDQVDEKKLSLSLVREEPEDVTPKNVSNAENREINDADEASPAALSDDKRTCSRSLGTIILDRLTDNQVAIAGEKSDFREIDKSECPIIVVENDSDSDELRTICRDLLNELLNDISLLIEETPGNRDEQTTLVVDKISEDIRDSLTSGDPIGTSIQCSLPLDKVASMLKNCQNPADTSSSSTPITQQTSKIVTKPPSPTIRHLCLYCDRKFLSISLRQRHTERVHQLGGGRRSERNSRKTTQNCQFCSDKCADNLDGLFHHMIGKHPDKYHACVQCTTRYSTRDVLIGHMTDVHGYCSDKPADRNDKTKDLSVPIFKEPPSPVSRDPTSHSSREKTEIAVSIDRRIDEDHEQRTGDAFAHSPNSAKSCLTQSASRSEAANNTGASEFDSAFYSSVSCNIRENLLHHLDGKLHLGTSAVAIVGGSSCEPKASIQSPQHQQQQQQQSFYDNSANQIQCPIDISLTAATPVYTKEYNANDDYENSSEYAQKPGKTGRSHPRRVSFEKYNFPRKYDGKEQWSCSIKDLSKFDITTQLTLRKKQQLIKDKTANGRINQTTINSTIVERIRNDHDNDTDEKNCERIEEAGILVIATTDDSNVCASGRNSGTKLILGGNSNSATVSNDTDLEESLTTDLESSQDSNATNVTEFTAEFGNFLRLRKWNECNDVASSSQEIVYAELTGEWSRPRIYICGACTSRHVTLREMEEHKASSHPNVWCSHLEFTGDQRELYKHLFLPGRCLATAKAKNAVLAEKVCTKCSKICGSLAELHRHMLECGGDQAWLLGLFGNGKKKCKWRPFGSRSRRRRQRGMKRNIQNSQTPRVNQPRERNSSGPRVRPSDRESIQKMLANLPPKRASRRVMQDTTVRTQGRLRKMQTRSRPRLVEPLPSNSRLSRKAVLRNKLLKNAKSFQRKRCRGDNITASIESVVKNSDADEDVDDDSDDDDEEEDDDDDVEDDSGRVFKESRKFESNNARGETSKGRGNLESSNRSTKIVRGVRVVSKKRNVKSKNPRTVAAVKSRGRVMKKRRTLDADNDEVTRNAKNSSKNGDKSSTNYSSDNQADGKSPSSSSSSPSHSALLRRKKHVNPVVSLHASLKARNQLRTHDGKFARKNTEIRGTRSSSGVAEKRALVTPASLRTLARRQDSGRLVTRAKLRTARRASNDAKVTRRTIGKRNSSDSEKSPKSEGIEEKTDNKEKVAEKSSTDSALLSPISATIGNNRSDAKNSRGSSRSSSASKIVATNNQQTKNIADIDLDEAIEKSVIDVTQIKNSAQNTSREQRPTRARRKKIVRDADKYEEIDTSVSKEESRVEDSAREFRAKNRQSLPTRASSSTDYSEESSRRRCSSKDSKSREVENDETTRKTTKLESQSTDKKSDSVSQINNSRQTRQERRTGSLEDFSKFHEVPDEVKKLLGPSDDLFPQIGTKKRDKTKRQPRQPPKPRGNTPKTRIQKKNASIEDSKTEDSEAESCEQKEKISLRKSPRNAYKRESKNFEKIENSKCDDKDIETIATENKIEDTEVDIKVASASIDDTTPEVSEDNPRANNSIGKRRGRIKSRGDATDIEKSLPEPEKEENEEREAINTSSEEAIEVPTENLDDEETSIDEIPKDLSPSDVATLSFEHLQQESNNSNIDSGKENSSETPVNVSKLKVVRPKKSRGFRRERMGKRTLNNVIGILTEGVNIPVEVQQSVVLTVQTSIEGATSETAVQSNPSPMADSNVAAVKPNESSDAACSSSAAAGEEPKSTDCTPQLFQQIESENIEKSNENFTERTDTNVSQIQCYNVPEVITAAPIPSKPIDSVPPSVVEQPTNDIILDLSRRKPKVKGSFLEKIVSKIAKQKDALLEIEVGCLLDHAADELTSILDEVSPATKESSDTTKSAIIVNEKSVKIDAEKTVLEVAEKSMEENSSVSSAVSLSVEKPAVHNDNAAVSVQTNSTINEPKNKGETEVQPTEEQTLGSGILPTASQDFSATLETLEAETPNSETKRSSKKRSLDATTPRKNKRKTIDDNESDSNSSDDEICLADIMKLINSAKQSSSRVEERLEPKVRPGKRKTMDLDKDENLTITESSDSVVSIDDEKIIQPFGSDVNKKTKRCNAKKIHDGEETATENVSDDGEKLDELLTEMALNSSPSVAAAPSINFIQLCPEDLSTTIPGTVIERKIDEIPDVSKSLESINEEFAKSTKAIEIPVADDKLKTKLSRKSRATRKKSLADEHLDLSDDEQSEDISVSSNEEFSCPLVDVASALNLSVSSQISTTPVPVESFKVPELNEFLGSAKKRNAKKKSLAGEHLELLEETCSSLPKNFIPSEPIDVKKDANNEKAVAEDDDKKSVDEIKVEKEKSPLGCETRENDEIKTVEVSRVEESASIESDNSEVCETSKNKIIADDDKDIVEETQTDTSVTDSECTETDDDASAEKRRNLTRKAKDNAPPLVDDLASFSDAKLQRKFAVVHTKSGKMLIVEKKKKFTKEAAKFFCEVCAASFTRKSSLKKHNSSQSHLLQLSKCGDEIIERNDAALEEDATVSSIDASDDISNSVELSEETKDPLATEIDEKTENIENDTTDETNLRDPLGECAENSKNDVEEDESVALETQQDDATFGKQDSLEDDLEDELLDEEICKITENMTHDEYVLTDHVSPVLPEAASTPVNNVVAKAIVIPEIIDKIIDDKIKITEETLKINLADEHLNLDSPIPSEILAEIAIPCLLDDSIEETSRIATILNIPQPPVRSTIINEETNGTTIADETAPIKTIEKIETIETTSNEAEDSITEKPTKSRRKNNKRAIGKFADTNEIEIFQPEVTSDEKNSISKDTATSIANPIEDVSTHDAEMMKKDATIEIPSDTAVYDFLPENSGKANSIVALDFSNITEKLKAREAIGKDVSPRPVEFDSDEDSSDTNMSNDIRKLLDDPELDTDNRQTAVESNFEIPENLETSKISMSPKRVVTPAKKNKQQKTKSEIIDDDKTSNEKIVKQIPEDEDKKISSRQSAEKKVTRCKNTAKESTRKSRTSKPRRNNNTPRNRVTENSSDSDYDDKKDDNDTQNKNKIVKCVFGRVFAGEKVDKVKEVLDDWVSRSEGDSHDDSRASIDDKSVTKVLEATIATPEAKRSRNEDEKSSKRRSPSSTTVSKSRSRERTRSRNRKRCRSKNRTRETSSGSEDIEKEDKSVERRSRSKGSAQSRKRNTEKKSLDSIPTKTLPAAESTPSSRCRQSKKRAEERISRAFEDESSIAFDDHVLMTQLQLSTATKTSRHGKESREETEDGKLALKKQSAGSGKSKKRGQDENPEETIEFMDSEREKIGISAARNNGTPSGKRERSLSPEHKSRKGETVIKDIDETSTIVGDDEEDEDEIAMGRLSPLYVCNSPASSMNSDTNSDEDNNETKDRENRPTRRRSISAFSGDKVVIRSPTSLSSNREDRTEVVTIAPTDAIEDNALDVPRDIVTSPSQKPRQGKVLNFDEELFVECCSRLKATTENELRGAKKIKLDHSEGYSRNEEQGEGFRSSRDRWRDVESQNSLGSLLESVNQLLGEEMYSGSRTNEYAKRGRNIGSERSSRTASPDVDVNRRETLGYEDSLDVAFEHNNKLRVKIQQRMKESENLIASTFGQKSGKTGVHRHHHHHHHHHHHRKEHANEGTTASAVADRLNDVNQSVNNGDNYADIPSDKSADRSLSSNLDQTAKHVEIECSNFRSKNPALGGLLDKALSNILHSNGKHDHHGSTPMNVLAELACARVPTATIPEVNSSREKSSTKSPSRTRESSIEERSIVNNKEVATKKARNPIKELFERKKEINERKQQHHQEKSENDVALREINVQRQKKSKKPKRQQQDFPLIRKSQLGGMVERKKRRDGTDRKVILEDTEPERIKDIYDFDDDESQPETGPGAVLSYRNKNEKNCEVMSCVRAKELDMTDLMTKTIGDTLKNGKTGDALGRRLESMINRKFQEIETFAPKTKGALKSFQMEEKQQQQQQQQQQVTGPMDDFVERKQRSRKLTEQSSGKHGRSKRRNKNSKKKSRNAWYENDSSDEFITAAKAEDVGVGITKSQRQCSKGKQNLFAELSTTSESDYDDEDIGYEAKRRLARLSQKKIIDKQREKEHRARISPELADNYPQEHEDNGIVDWINVTSKTERKNDLENKKSESEMSDHPLVIDERKTETDEQRNSDDDTETRYNPPFELDDLYREDSSVADSDPEEDANERTESRHPEDSKITAKEETATVDKLRYSEEKELIPLEEALDLLDNNEDLTSITERNSPRNTETSDNREEPVNAVEETLIRDKDEDEDDEEIEDYKELENECTEASIPDEPDEDLPDLPEKFSSNEKPQKGAENLPLHVFLSRKVQESKKRKQQQQKKIQEEQERILMEFAPTRRQRKCAIGKQGLLAEISSSDEESYARETCRRSTSDKSENERQSRKPKRESKEKRKERYMEKKHEQIIAKEQKAIEEEILRELGKSKGSSGSIKSGDSDSGKSERNASKDNSVLSDKSEIEENEVPPVVVNTVKKKRQQKSKKIVASEDSRNNATNEETENVDNATLNDTIVAERKSNIDAIANNVKESDSPMKTKRQSKSSQRTKKSAKTPDAKVAGGNRKSRIINSDRAKNKNTTTNGKDSKERRSSSGKRDSDDEELRTTKCWNKVEEGVGVAIGRRKRAAANQLYYWSSSSDDDEPIPPPTPVVEEEDDRQEQHGWIVGDSHKRMITMLAMEKQLKEKRRRSEDEFEPGKSKNKKHRNSTS